MKRDTLPCWPDEHSDYTVFPWRGLMVSTAVLSVPSRSQETKEVPENYLIVIVQGGLRSKLAVVLAEVEPHVKEDVARS
jgi:phosphoserine aminotransferase